MSQENAIKKRCDFPEYRHNPTIEEAMEHMASRNKPFSQGEQTMIVGSSSGEILRQGTTMYLERKVVDRQQYNKVYRGGLAKLLGLPKSAHRVLQMIELLINDNPGKDNFPLHFTQCADYPQKLINSMSRRTFDRGVNELLEGGLLFRTPIPHHYFFNVVLLYNGDRTIIATEYVRASAAEQLEVDQTNVLEHDV